MMKRLAIAAGLLLAACSTPAAPTFPPITFVAKPPLRLDVSSVQIEAANQPMVDEMTTPHYLPETPLQAVRTWAQDRLSATGDTGGIATFVVERADARAEQLPVQRGLRGMFTDEQSVRYVMRIEARLEIRGGGRAGPGGTARVSVERSATSSENATGDDRRRTLYRLLDATMSDFDMRMESEIKRNLGEFLRQ